MQINRNARRAYGTGSVIIRSGNYFGKWRVGDRQIMRKLGPVRKVGHEHGSDKGAGRSSSAQANGRGQVRRP